MVLFTARTCEIEEYYIDFVNVKFVNVIIIFNVFSISFDHLQYFKFQTYLTNLFGPKFNQRHFEEIVF